MQSQWLVPWYAMEVSLQNIFGNSPLSATSHRPLCSLDWLILFVLRVGTTMAQTRSLATIGPSLGNAFPSSLCLTLLSGSLSASLSLLNTYFYSHGICTWSATEWSLPWATLYKFRNTIRYTIRIATHSDMFWAVTWKGVIILICDEWYGIDGVAL